MQPNALSVLLGALVPLTTADSTDRGNTLDAVKAEGSVADEAKAANLLFGEPEGLDVGSLAQRRFSSAHRAVV